MSAKVIKNIVNPYETIATIGETFRVVNRYTSYGTEWIDLANDRTRINVQVTEFNNYFKEV